MKALRCRYEFEMGGLFTIDVLKRWMIEIGLLIKKYIYFQVLSWGGDLDKMRKKSVNGRSFYYGKLNLILKKK